ncbi:MAG: hypothetical protein KJO09_03930 [Gammaproteobacteria bacterium]|nr:hypothetical protein [Gammaproteobacteria bacterium]
MQTILDEGHTWFLESLAYEGGLTITLVEGLTGDTPQDLKVGDTVIENTYPVETNKDSKRVVVKFGVPVAWQVIDESYTSWDEAEVRDTKGYLQVLSKSKYLDYVNSNHGWYKDVGGDGAHYRVWTENEVIDVVAQESPEISQT